MALNLQHQTPAQFAAKFRQRFKSAEKVEAWKLATKLLGWIDAGDITDAQARNAFGLTVNQWNDLKTRLTVMRTRYSELQAAQGE
jgi:hypothetical protein